MIGQVEASEPRITIVQALHFAKILDQFVLGRPIEPIRRRERIALQIIQHFGPAIDDCFPLRRERRRIRIVSRRYDQACYAIEKLPRWKAVCDSPGANTVILDQLAFGKSENEMFLLGLAIKYAGIAGKDIMICSGEPGRFEE